MRDDSSFFLRTPQILEVAAAVERGCRHPLAEAVVLAAQEKVSVSPERSSPLHAEGLRTVPGLGASAQVCLQRFGVAFFNGRNLRMLFLMSAQARLAWCILAFTCCRAQSCIRLLGDLVLLEATVPVLIRV